MEYLFKKDELLKLLFDATDSNTVAISINFKPAESKGAFTAEIIAKATFRDPATGTQVDSSIAAPLKGCPNPPGC